MALLHVLARLRQPLGLTLVAHGVDHGLREGAAQELDVARAFGESLEVPWSQTKVLVLPGGNLQARARLLRLEALRARAAETGATHIATAHHADDRAETVLLRLLRGASPAGLAVLPPREGDLVRPLLRARRAAIDAHLHRHAIPFSTDPSNRDPRFLRTRVRRELLPLLTTLSPGIVDHLNGLADDLNAQRLAGIEGSDVGSGLAPLPPLPRSARVALAQLVASRSKTARVTLPQGLVVSFVPNTPGGPKEKEPRR